MYFRYLVKKMMAVLMGLLLVMPVFAQTDQGPLSVCKDSSGIIRYHSSETFQRSKILPLADGGTVSWGGMDDGYTEFNYVSVFRTDITGAVQWSVKLSPPSGYNFEGIEISASTNTGFVITGTAGMGIDNVPPYFFIASLDYNGALLWYHYYEIALSGSVAANWACSAGKPAIDRLGNIYQPVSYANTRDGSVSLVITKFSATGALLWNKSFLQSAAGTQLFMYQAFEQNDTLTLFGYSGGQASFINMQLKSTDASLINVKAFKPVNYAAFAQHPVANVVEKTPAGNYIAYGKVSGGNGDISGIDFNTVIFDQKLNPVKRFQVKTLSVNYANGWGGVDKNMIVGQEGEILYGVARNQENSMYYAVLDDRYQVLTQKKLQYSSPLSGNFYLPPLASYNNGRLLMRTNGCAAVTNTCGIDYLYTNKGLTALNSCFTATDTSFIELLPFDLNPVVFSLGPEQDNVLNETTIGLTQQPTFTDAVRVCGEISICKTPVIESADSICLGSDMTIITAHKGSECNGKISWKMDTSATERFSVLNDTTLAATFKKPWKGYISAAIASGCGMLKDSLLLTVYKPDVHLPGNGGICRGSTALLKAGDGYKSYLWQDGSSTSSYIATQPGKYWVEATDALGCAGSDTTTISKWLDPPINFLSKDTVLCELQTLEIKTSHIADALYLWSNGTVSSSIKVSAPGEYWLKLTDENGCSGTDTIYVKEKPCPDRIAFPNAFSPNNDGLNEVFKPIAQGRITDYSLVIFNRWGEKVFESTDPVKGWDGSSHGKKQDTGSFIWFCRYQLPGGHPAMQKGNLFLIR